MARLCDLATEVALTATRLRVPYPFHNRVLTGVAADVSTRVAMLPRRAPRLRVYSPILGRYPTVLPGHRDRATPSIADPGRYVWRADAPRGCARPPGGPALCGATRRSVFVRRW